jgi:hypothetical protein
MQHLIDGVRHAVASESWHAALALALALPDACGRIQEPNERVGIRYRRWAREFFEPYVTLLDQPYLTARELYAFRCVYLHEGDFQLDDDGPDAPNMFAVLNEIRLYATEVVAARGMTSSAQGHRTSYAVSVGELCEWICRAAEDWFRIAQLDPTMNARMAALGRIWRFHLDGNQTPL